jgi:replicative DNA helicase
MTEQQDLLPGKARVPPNSKESEMMVLGCMLTSINSLNMASERLLEADFYYSEHKLIFRTLQDAYKSDKPADVHLIAEELKRQDKLHVVGGVMYLTTLAQYAGTSAYIDEYIAIVKDKALLRQMVVSAQHVEKNAFDEPSDVSSALDEAQQLFFKIGQSRNNKAGELIGDILAGKESEQRTPFLKVLEERQERYMRLGPQESAVLGIPTHFTDLDKMIHGFNNSHLIILASRPGMGKTAFSLNVAEGIAFRNRIPVGIFSLEMTAEQLVHRIVCSQSEVESNKILTGALSSHEFHQVVDAVSEIQQHIVVIDDQPGVKITDLRARARRMKESHNVGCIIIDYLQLISGSGFSKNAENRQNEISEISRMLKVLARELDIPILCLSQLSRKVEERQGHRPMMSDLRESGCLTGDTIIRDAKTGKSYSIKELAERKNQAPLSIHAVNEDLTITEHRMIKAFYSGRKIVFELKMRSGRSIKASANHPFLLLSGWTPLEKLRAGNKIGLPRKLLFSETSPKIEDDELILLGHLLGDGCILPKQPYHYTSADEKNISIVCKTASNLFGITPRIVKQKNWFHVYLPSPYHLTHAKHHPITDWYKKLGLERVRSYEKRIPHIVFECPNHQLALFLHHLWSTDGNISSTLTKRKKFITSIYYASSSKLLCEQVQHLLLRLGILSTVNTVRSSKGYRNMYHLRIQGSQNQEMFLHTVGCAGERGKIVPQLLEDQKNINRNPNLDIIPKEAWKTIVNAERENCKISWRELCSKLNWSYSGSSLFASGISRARMAELHKAIPSEKLLQLANSHLYWDEILSINEVGEEDVYDATVEGAHNFVANDILVHNSIEQDADIVLFLVRREYYDPYDRPGQAELIVAKNRHGETGSITLTYRKEIAQFANFSQQNYQPSPGGGPPGSVKIQLPETDYAFEP